MKIRIARCRPYLISLRKIVLKWKQWIRLLCSIKEHLHILEEDISVYFYNLPDTPFAPARSLLTVEVDGVQKNAQEEFMELIASDAAEIDFTSTDFTLVLVTKCWIKWYPVMSEIMLHHLLFPTVYLCEIRLSRLLVINF